VDANGLPNIPASVTRPTSNVTALETRDRTPYNQTLQFGLQRQIGSTWLAEVDYVATKGTKLPVVLPWNQLRPDQFGAGAQQQLKRPFPQYLNVSALTNDGNAIYHSLQAKIEHRWHNGLQLQVAYTLSKLIDDVDGPARSNGADMVEVDIRTTSDGKLVLMHDRSVDRTTNAHGEIAKMTLAEVHALDAGIKKGKQFENAQVPTFDEALDLVGPQAGVYLDCKDVSPELLIAAVERHGLTDRVVI
jgi:hypothetical protein